MENAFGEKRVLQLQTEGREEPGPAQALRGTRLPGLLSRSGANAQVSACTCARCGRVERRENSAEVPGKAVHLNSQAGAGPNAVGVVGVAGSTWPGTCSFNTMKGQVGKDWH